MLPILCVKCRNSSTGCMGATVVDRKGASEYANSFLTALLKSLGFKRILVRSDNERSLLSLIERVTCNLTGVELVLMTSPEGDHQANGLAEVGVREIKAQTRILRSQLEQRLGSRTDGKDPLMSWIPRHAANCVSRYRIMDDGRTPDQRRCGKTWNVQWWSLVSQYTSGENNALRGGDQRLLRGVYVGHHERSGAAIFLTPDGVKRGTKIARMMEHERWDRVFSATCVGVPWQLKRGQRNLVKPVVPEAEAEQGVAPVIMMPAVPKVDRRRYVTKRDLVKYGYTDECQACTQLASGMHNAKVPHDDRCRDRIGVLMASDDDQRQVERVTSRAVVEVENEISCPEVGEEVEVGEPTVVEDQRSQSASQSVSHLSHQGIHLLLQSSEPRVQGQGICPVCDFAARPATKEQTAFQRQPATSFPTRSDELPARSRDSSTSFLLAVHQSSTTQPGQADSASLLYHVCRVSVSNAQHTFLDNCGKGCAYTWMSLC